MSKGSEDRRLWIGNLDPRVNEYQLLKLVQKYGTIEKFDLLFHRNGPLAGQPRGYAFVTYNKQEDALRAKQLHNTQLGTKNITVTWAHSIPQEEYDKPKKVDVNIPALALSKCEKKTDRDCQIQAIEAKLKMMEKQNQKAELEINKTVATEYPLISQYQYNKQNVNTKVTFNRKNSRHKPYDSKRTYR